MTPPRGAWLRMYGTSQLCARPATEIRSCLAAWPHALCVQHKSLPLGDLRPTRRAAHDTEGRDANMSIIGNTIEDLQRRNGPLMGIATQYLYSLVASTPYGCMGIASRSVWLSNLSLKMSRRHSLTHHEALAPGPTSPRLLQASCTGRVLRHNLIYIHIMSPSCGVIEMHAGLCSTGNMAN